MININRVWRAKQCSFISLTTELSAMARLSVNLLPCDTKFCNKAHNTLNIYLLMQSIYEAQFNPFQILVTCLLNIIITSRYWPLHVFPNKNWLAYICFCISATCANHLKLSGLSNLGTLHGLYKLQRTYYSSNVTLTSSHSTLCFQTHLSPVSPSALIEHIL